MGGIDIFLEKIIGDPFFHEGASFRLYIFYSKPEQIKSLFFAGAARRSRLAPLLEGNTYGKIIKKEKERSI